MGDGVRHVIAIVGLLSGLGGCRLVAAPCRIASAGLDIISSEGLEMPEVRVPVPVEAEEQLLELV